MAKLEFKIKFSRLEKLNYQEKFHLRLSNIIGRRPGDFYRLTVTQLAPFIRVHPLEEPTGNRYRKLSIKGCGILSGKTFPF
jgi:hypothetical protein